jgi:C4-dicarboxylate-specific signal transduction histidine kinase
MIYIRNLGAAPDDTKKDFDAALIRTYALTLANEALREAQVDLAHVDRITTIGRLTASIAPEVTQPIAAIVTNAQAARHFLDRRPPDLDEVREALDCIVTEAYRASDVIYRIRGLFKETPPKRERAEINGAIRDVLELTRGEATKNGVSVRTQFAEPSPVVQADRVQLQQVILNLIINAVEAMSSMREGARELLICTEKAESNGALVAVRDSGPGLDLKSVDRLFEAFYTTKLQGMGIGLAICRSIIEAHGGRLWANANVPCGAIFQFTLPATRPEHRDGC